jgi:hypothetical protein
VRDAGCFQAGAGAVVGQDVIRNLHLPQVLLDAGRDGHGRLHADGCDEPTIDLRARIASVSVSDGNAKAAAFNPMTVIGRQVHMDPQPADAAGESPGRASAGGTRTDLAAFEALMRLHNRMLYRVARSILRSDTEAEDVLQDAYLEAYRSLEQFRGDARLSTWRRSVRARAHRCHGP